jgi:hypothetical protein
VEASNTPTIRRLTPHAVTNFRVHLCTVADGLLQLYLPDLRIRL